MRNFFGLGSSEAVNISPTDDTLDLVDRTIYTFSTQAVGTPASDRRVVVAVHGGVSGGTTLSSATIGGIAATIILQSTPVGLTGAIIIASVPTGTTADVVLTWAAEIERCAVSVYRMVGASSGTASDTASDTTLSGDVLSVTLTIPPGGAAVAIAQGTDGTSVTWAGLAEDTDFTVDNVAVSSSSRNAPSQDTNLTVSATFAATPTSPVLVTASWAV